MRNAFHSQDYFISTYFTVIHIFYLHIHCFQNIWKHCCHGNGATGCDAGASRVFVYVDVDCAPFELQEVTFAG